MSNSIWKKPGFHEAIDDKLKVSKDGKWVYWTMYGWNIPGEDVHDIGVEWAYLEDVLAQADKAKRLQEAVDVANEALKYARQRGLDNTATLFAVGTKADKALDEIRQLIKETQ